MAARTGDDLVAIAIPFSIPLASAPQIPRSQPTVSLALDAGVVPRGRLVVDELGWMASLYWTVANAGVSRESLASMETTEMDE
jgi:hypothetical protein